jgi:hypothetical protein
MNKNNLEETKKSNKQSGINGGSSTYSNDATSKAKGQLSNESAANDFSNSASDFDKSSISSMDSSVNDATLEERKKINARSAANKGTAKKY